MKEKQMTVTRLLDTGAPLDQKLRWHLLDWTTIEREVKRLQMRIAKATREKRYGKVRALQRLLTHSYYAKLLAVKRVTSNKGSRTPGVDGIVWKSHQKFEAVKTLRNKGYRAQPLRRIYIPKKSGKKRPLGIPTMKDRAMQAIHLLGLEPVAESTSDPGSYGFRPLRSTQDAMEHCYNALSCKNRAEWILEADIKACFDQISHQWLVDHVVMDRKILKQWLKAGYLEKQKLYCTEEGTPQGGIATPTTMLQTI